MKRAGHSRKPLLSMSRKDHGLQEPLEMKRMLCYNTYTSKKDHGNYALCARTIVAPIHSISTKDYGFRVLHD
jgi:hypothetical protein